MHDQNLYQILYGLSEISGESSYSDAADEALRWFFTHAYDPTTHFLAWGEHLSWDFREEKPFLASGGDVGTHEYFRPWELWPRCFSLAPDAAARYATAVWEHQIGDHEIGAFPDMEVLHPTRRGKTRSIHATGAFISRPGPMPTK